MNTLPEPTMPSAMAQLLSLLSNDALSGSADMSAWSADVWEGIIELAARQGVSPLLYHRLSNASLPEPVLSRLRRHYLRTAADNTLRFAAMEEALLAMQKADVSVILLKGAHLAPLVYGNIALRPMVDLDLLVAEGDLQTALEVLAHLGYAPVASEAWMNVGHGHYSLRRDGHLVELHQRVGAFLVGAHIDQDSLWERATRTTVGASPARVLNPGDLLLHTCVHSASHHLLQLGLMPLCDVRQILVHYGGQIVPQEIVARAKEWRVARALFLMLSLSHTLLGAPVDRALLEALAPPDAQEHLRLGMQILLNEATQDSPPSTNVTALWGEPSWRARLGVLGRVLVPTTERMRSLYGVPAGRPVRPWLYLRRWVDVVIHRGRSMRQAVGRPNEDIDWRAFVRWLAEG